MKEKLRHIALSGGACAFGVAPARVYTEMADILKKRGRVKLVSEEVRERTDPFLTMPEAKSIIVCLYSYYIEERSRISSYAMGLDYHEVLSKKLREVAEELIKDGYKARCFADNGPLSDRHMAYLAGLGFFGKNGMFINEKFGSKVFIGYIMTDCPLPCDKPVENDMCMGCGKCISSCPGGAIGEGFFFDEEKCASYLTQKKGPLSPGEEEIIKKSGYIWGCDICQDVCPYNHTALLSGIDEFSKDLIKNIDIPADMTNRQFKEKYAKRAFLWRGKAVLIRNMDLYK